MQKFMCSRESMRETQLVRSRAGILGSSPDKASFSSSPSSGSYAGVLVMQ